MQTSQYREFRIWEMKENKYRKSLAKNRVCAAIHMRDIQRNSNVFNPHKSFPGRQLNVTSHKSLEIQASSITRRRTHWNRKFV